MNRAILLVAAVALLSGCVTRVGEFTFASTKNIDIKRTAHRVDESIRLIDRDVTHIIVVVPTGFPDMVEAMNRTIEQEKNAVGLANVTIKRGKWYIPYIYGRQYIEVEGNPIYEIDPQE